MDREKVIKSAEICLEHIDESDCPQECPYFEQCYKYEKRVIFQPLIRDALTLLKEQEAVKPVRDKEIGRIWLCGNCGTYVGFEDHDDNDPNEFDKYCRECGRPVLWEGR